MAKEKVVGFYEITANRILNRLGLSNERSFPEWNRGRGGSGGAGVFVLAEDCSGPGPVYAWPASINPDTGAIVVDEAATEPFKLYHTESALFSPKEATAGYKGQWKTIDGLRVFDFGGCIDGCQTTASIDPGSPPDGEVGAAYTHTVVVSGLDEDGVSASDLPPGLVINADTGAITGTPTTPGTYWVTFTATSDDTPPCPLTRIAQIVIWAEGEAPDPDPGGGA